MVKGGNPFPLEKEVEKMGRKPKYGTDTRVVSLRIPEYLAQRAADNDINLGNFLTNSLRLRFGEDIDSIISDGPPGELEIHPRKFIEDHWPEITNYIRIYNPHWPRMKSITLPGADNAYCDCIMELSNGKLKVKNIVARKIMERIQAGDRSI